MNEPDFSKWTKDPRSTEELIGLALTETDEHAMWEPVTVLHFRGTREVLEVAEQLCSSADPRERLLGTNILGQLGVPSRTFPNECFDRLAGTLTTESDPDVLQAIAIAFGFLEDPRCVELLLPLKDHLDSDVRYGVVHGMSKQSDPRAIQTLIGLSTDEDSVVRDWATFGLGTLTDYDSRELRDALVARLNDAYVDARFEALVGLARRKDDRALAPLLESLSADTVYEMAIEAAQELANPRLLPALLDLRKSWAGDDDRFVTDLDSAIDACQPPQPLSPFGSGAPPWSLPHLLVNGVLRRQGAFKGGIFSPASGNIAQIAQADSGSRQAEPEKQGLNRHLVQALALLQGRSAKSGIQIVRHIANRILHADTVGIAGTCCKRKPGRPYQFERVSYF